MFQGDALLLRYGPSCTSEAGATSDRWCAFYTTNAAGTGLTLFVVNVTQASRGVTVSCNTTGATDPNCLRLTNTYYPAELITPDPDPFHAAFFEGDTLVYYEETGTPFGWRPGLTAARTLYPSTGEVYFCTGATRGTGILCLRDLPTQSNPNVLQSELLAGRMDGMANPALVKVDDVISLNSNDAGYDRFSFGFPVAGAARIAWSTRATETGPEILKTQEIGNDAGRVTVASNVHYWDTSPDGSRWYWMSAIDEVSVTGTLQSAPFPGGASPTTILANTSQFVFVTSTRLATVTGAGALAVIPDPVGAPATSTALDSAVLGMLRISSQGHIAYAKNFISSPIQVTDMLVKKSDGTGACTISAVANVDFPLAQFSPNAGGLLWAQVNAGEQGYYTLTADCTTTMLATGLQVLGQVGDVAVLFGDTANATNGTYALRSRDVLAGNALASSPTLISSVVTTMSVAGPGSGPLVYTTGAGLTSDGLFVRAYAP